MKPTLSISGAFSIYLRTSSVVTDRTQSSMATRQRGKWYKNTIKSREVQTMGNRRSKREEIPYAEGLYEEGDVQSSP